MINELAECEQYLTQHNEFLSCIKRQACVGCIHRLCSGYTFECFNCPDFTDTVCRLESLPKKGYRFKERYYSTPGRVLRILARYWLFNDEESKCGVVEESKGIVDMKLKIDDVSEKLFTFYCDVILSKSVLYAPELKGKLDRKFMESLGNDIQKKVTETKDKSLQSKYAEIHEELGKLERYMRPYLEQTDNAFTFYSIIADAKNAGPLLDRFEIRVRAAEVVFILEATGYGKTSRHPDITTPKLILALICRYRAASDDQKLKNGHLPIVMEDVNAWMSNSKASQKKSQLKSAFDFLQFLNISNSLRYKIDEDLLSKKIVGITTNLPDFVITDAGGNIKSELKQVILETGKSLKK